MAIKLALWLNYCFGIKAFIDLYIKFERLFKNIFNSYKSKLNECIIKNSFDESLITRLYDFNIMADYAKKDNTNYRCILFSKSVF